MSQRGLRPQKGRLTIPTRWWGNIGKTLAFTLTLIFGSALYLLAQDTLSPKSPLKTVQLSVGGQLRQVETAKATVRELLWQEKIALDPHDLCEPALSAQVTDGMKVTVHRVTYEQYKERVPVQSPVVTRWDRRMTTTPITLRQGKPGVAVQTRCLWKKNGKVTVQWTQGRATVVKPTPTLQIRGKIPSRGGAVTRRTLRVVATAYDPGPGSCGASADGCTAIGMVAQKGVIAVDPRVIPLGSRVYIEGYGTAIAGDVGGAIKGNRIDVCFSTRREALQWGRRTVTLVILK